MLNKIINLIFPPKCIFCGELPETSSGTEICSSCYKLIPFFSDNYGIRNSSEFCDFIICVAEYSGIVKNALKRYKFNGKSSYCRAFSKLLADKVKRMTNCRKIDIIVSVPLHKSREVTRGYNQALLISRILSRETGIREDSRVLTRAKATNTQSLISSKHGRQDNVKDAFEVVYPERVCGKSVMLIDDIMTTGYTLDECSRVLKKAGAVQVIAGVIASGRKY